MHQSKGTIRGLQETWAVVDNDRCFTHFLSKNYSGRNRFADVFSPRITSTNGIMCTGLKKCIPTKFSGRCRFLAKRVIEMVEVFDAMIVFVTNILSVSASTAAFTFWIFSYCFNHDVHFFKVVVA